jgi:uncharacterized membrane protein
MQGPSKAQSVSLMLAVVFFVAAGTWHFIKPGFYLKIMPPYIPWHLQMVLISGFFEILGGLGLLIPQTRRLAAWGLVALLIAVFPGQHLYGHKPNRSGRRFYCTCTAVGASALAIASGLVASLVYAASRSTALTR